MSGPRPLRWRVTNQGTIQSPAMFIMYSTGGAFACLTERCLQEQSQAVDTWEEKTVVASFCTRWSIIHKHSHLHTCPLRPEEGFARPASELGPGGALPSHWSTASAPDMLRPCHIHFSLLSLFRPLLSQEHTGYPREVASKTT